MTQLYSPPHAERFNLSSSSLGEPRSNYSQLPAATTDTLLAIQEFEDYMIQIRYSDNTVRSYTESLKTFLRFTDNKQTHEITQIDLENFNRHYILANNYSDSYQNQVINALKLYFTKKRSIHLNVKELERPISSYRLPVVLSLEEVERLLNVINNIKHRSMLTVIYSCGLRSGELLNLKIADIDSNRMVIHIKKAKGKKDRIVPLPLNTLELLRVYFKAYRPKVYLFNGGNSLLYSR
ncbi:MAG: tyrosine-type recombinase/integrase, partial [Crocinitomicaceae bacterium]|nr:tyrosine-type recombinase/integrase [Crocinitomicaceae bacterium]